MVSGRNTKGLWDANRKDGFGKRHASLLTIATIDELRKELSLIDKTIEALIKLSRLRGSKPLKHL
jgi:hypothetical protein